MKILITGAGGLVGRKLFEHFSAGYEVVPLRHEDLDITIWCRVLDLIEAEQPDIIFNCAVIGVDECEADLDKALAVNVDGPANLARAAQKCAAGIVHFSSNYVFDGGLDGGYYTIDDEPRPINVYGRTKWEGEQAVASECERSFVIRTSWVYGGGKNSFFDNAIAALRKGENVQAIADNSASTTFVDDLVERVAEIVGRGRYGTYHIVNQGVCSKYEFATEAARLICGSDDLVELVTEAGAGFSGKRPPYTPMRCTLSEEIGLLPMREWQAALAAYVL